MAHSRGAALPMWGAYILSSIAIGMGFWSVVLQPWKMRMMNKVAESNLALANAMYYSADSANNSATATRQYLEYMKAADERYETEKRLNRENQEKRK